MIKNNFFSRLLSSTAVSAATSTNSTPARSLPSRRNSPSTSRLATRVCWTPSPRTARSRPSPTPRSRRSSPTSLAPSPRNKRLAILHVWRQTELWVRKLCGRGCMGIGSIALPSVKNELQSFYHLICSHVFCLPALGQIVKSMVQSHVKQKYLSDRLMQALWISS